jgi:cell division protein FtsI (penicillin-binding protein 3)
MHQRLMIGMIIYGAIVGFIVLRLIYLAAFGDHAGRKGGAIDLAPERGDVVDRDGQSLARDDRRLDHRPAAGAGHRRQVRAGPEAGRADAREGRRDLPRDAAVEAQILLSPPPRRAGAGRRDQRARRAGLALSREPDRLYPQTALAAHVLGYTDVDGKGSAGIERAFNDRLTDPAKRGEPIILSISSPVQQALEHELQTAMTEFSAIGAAGVVMNIHTGEVLA